MAENNIQNSLNQDGEVKELLNMLDRMQNRPRVQEVEDALIQQGRPDLVRMDVYTAPTAQDGFVPNVPGDDLADLLITPGAEFRVASVQSTSTASRSEEHDPDSEHLLYWDRDEEEDWEQLPPAPEKKINPIQTLLRGAGMVLPRKEDSPLRILGKSGFWLGLLAVILAGSLLLWDMKVVPAQQQALHEELLAAYKEESTAVVFDPTFPDGMLSAFEQLYDRNQDVKGWISFHAEGKDFLNIEYPFVQGEDNDYYQTHDYDGNETDYGTLYVDADARIEGYYDTDRVLTIYSNNTPDQSMLSAMNRLIGPVDYARAVPELTLTTLYRRDIYYVFAVALTDSSGKDPFPLIQTEFADEDAFLSYIQSLCARSLFDYPVDVTYDDSIVLLTVPTGAVSSGITDGRIVVAARRRRAGEISVQANQIMKNKDAIMPYSWYTNRSKTLHPFFYSGEETTETTTTEDTTSTTWLTYSDDTTSTTEEHTGNVGGVQVDKDPLDATVTEITESTESTADSTSEPTSRGTVTTTGSTTSTTKPTTRSTTEKTTETTDPSQSDTTAQQEELNVTGEQEDTGEEPGESTTGTEAEN